MTVMLLGYCSWFRWWCWWQQIPPEVQDEADGGESDASLEAVVEA